MKNSTIKNFKKSYLDACFVVEAVKIGVKSRQIDGGHDFRLQQCGVTQGPTGKFVIVGWVMNDALGALIVVLPKHTTNKYKGDGKKHSQEHHFSRKFKRKVMKKCEQFESKKTFFQTAEVPLQLKNKRRMTKLGGSAFFGEEDYTVLFSI